MISFSIPLWSKYKEATQIHQGWEVPLHCTDCECNTLPKHETDGIDTLAVYLNSPETVYLLSTFSCSECDEDLKEEAAATLLELFKDIPGKLWKPSLILGSIVALFFVIPVMSWAGVFAGWWSDFGIWAYVALAANFLALLVAHYYLHQRIYQCHCGNPRFLLMGAIDRSYCFRCSNCGYLMRRE